MSADIKCLMSALKLVPAAEQSLLLPMHITGSSFTLAATQHCSVHMLKLVPLARQSVLLLLHT